MDLKREGLDTHTVYVKADGTYHAIYRNADLKHELMPLSDTRAAYLLHQERYAGPVPLDR